jgi:small subunit ribosomal protein S6
MSDYELVTIISPEVDGEAVSQVVDKVNQFITGREGTVEGTEQWGRKRLAYPIRRFLEGIYVLTRFKLEPRLIRELEVDLGAAEEVVRYLVVKVSG